jgi:hypothetical protein
MPLDIAAAGAPLEEAVQMSVNEASRRQVPRATLASSSA